MKKILLTLLVIAVVLVTPSSASADSPYTTWALGPGGYFFMTQDAYRPYAETDLDISGAEDMFFTPDGFLYIADTGKGRILKLKDFQEVASYGEDVLKGPSGLYVDEQGTMYVADAQLNEVVILDKDGNLIKEIGRPTEPLFGKTRDFLPRKIAVDARKNLYIVSEGSVDGIAQMNTNGNFIGYFGANSANMSLKMRLQRIFLTKEQLDQFIKNEAASPSNISIDHQSMVYTITAGTLANKAIRKFTVSGKNIFPDTHGSTTFRDIDISENGLVIAVDADGLIWEYDLNGTVLFVFGAKDTGDQRLGTLMNPTAIERFGEFIYVLDKDKNAIVSYQTTAFAREVHAGVRLYMDGFYSEAKPYFQQVLNYNGSFVMAYQAIADAYFKERNYSDALVSYKYAESRSGYSQAYWELRNAVLQRSLTSGILWIVGLWIAQLTLSRLDRKYKWFDPVRKWWTGLQRFKLFDDFVFMFDFIKRPAESYYYIKKSRRGSLRFALILYLWIIIVRILTLYLTGFVFNKYANPAYIRLGNEIVYTLVAFIIWNAANYLVSTISDGEGRVRDVITGTAYSLFPYVLFALPVALITRVLTLNEVFLYSFSMNIIYAWSALMIFIMVKEIHNYSFWETVKNILVTLFTAGMFLLTGYILYVLFNQLFEFISAIFQEIRLRG